MAITLEANYAKKLGLPNYSSHSYSVTIRTELTDLSQVEAESARLYRTLQDAVDREIQEVGFMPDATRYGMNNGPASNGASEQPQPDRNGHGRPPRRYENGDGNGNGNGSHNGNGFWRCSDKQRDLIEKIVRENSLVKREVEGLAVELFGAGVTQLDRLQASGLIDELLDRHGNKQRGRRQPYRREPTNAQARGGEE